MDNSEADMIKVVNTIWGKRKQIILFTILFVIGSVLFSNFQPKYYEIQKTAYFLQAPENIYKPRKMWPPEYYEKISQSPEILNAVLANLPTELRLGNDIQSVSKLNTLFRVKSKIIPAMGNVTTAGLKLIFFVRHTDPSSALEIAKVWQNVLEKNLFKPEMNLMHAKYSEKEEQLNSIKANWDEAKKRLLDTKKRYQIKNKTLELQSLHRLISSTREKLEKLESQRESRFFNYQQQIYWNEEDYLKTKKALSEYKRLQELQQATASSSGNNVNQNIIKNSARIKLQDEIITNEVHLKILSAQTNRLEQSIRELESENNNKIKTSQNTSFAQKKPLVDLFKININRFENKANELASTISEKTLEIRNLAQKETSLGTKYKSYLKDFKELESLKDSKQKTLDFSLSPLEPAVFQGSPMQKIILLSFGCGLIFTTLVILIKENFSAKKSDNINTKQPFVHYGEDYREDSLQNEAQAVKGEKITPNIKISEPLIESCPEPSPALMDAGFSVDR